MDCSSSTLLSMARASFFRAAEAPPHGAPTPCYIFSQPPLTLPRQPKQGPSSPWRPSPLLPAVTPRIFSSREPLPMGATPLQFPLAGAQKSQQHAPSPRALSARRNAAASSGHEIPSVLLASARSAQSRPKASRGCLDSPTLRRRSARFDRLRVSLRRICAAPTSTPFTPARNPVFCVEKASRSTLVDVRSYAHIESPTFLQTPIGFVYGPRDGDRARDMVPTTRCSWWTT
ncbi:nascent polypeptide-associated complex subunit alpha, muscle-specific form-like [Zea mays]|uniref:nascent polypeptide-associated complex subunit alpha, muscle-specific form-like n=1 Tax=Zea mays TaxID=4577 RepID=UPI0016532378|nr:nascent polypeptide-associated complex subunit alpha, muscle-specific form-like [Zea mays]